MGEAAELVGETRSAHKRAIEDLGWALERLIQTDAELDRKRVERLWEKMRRCQREYDDVLRP